MSITLPQTSNHMEAHESPVLAEPPFFVVGSGRSGTTLMRSMLSSHSRLAVTPETHFLKACMRYGGADLDRPAASMLTIWSAYCQTPRFAALGIEASACERYWPRHRDANVADVFAALLRTYLERTGKRRAGEKTPSHLHHAGWLFQAFPRARMIAMRRDPRAMIASLLGTPWRLEEDDISRASLARVTRLHAIMRDARRWAWVNGELIPGLERNERVHAVRYEDLVSEPEGALRQVTVHLGEQFEPGMLQPRSYADVDIGKAGMKAGWTSWLRRHEADAHAPVATASLEKWRDQLSRTEVALIEAVTGPIMQRFGYGPGEASAAERRRAVALAAAAGVACSAELGLRRAVGQVLGPARP